jgi:WD40 repeat protein
MEKPMRSIPYRLALLTMLLTYTLGADEPAPGGGKDIHGDPLPPGAIARLGTLRFRAGRGITHLAFSPDGKRLVAKSRSAVSVWDVASGRMLLEAVDQETGPLAWRSDGRGIALVRDAAGAVRFEDFTRARPAKSAPKEAKFTFIHSDDAAADNERINEYAMSPDGKYLVAGRAGEQDRARSLSVWEGAPGKTLAQLPPPRTLGPQHGTCHQIVFSSDGKTVGVLSGPNQPSLTQTLLFELYDLATGKERARRDVAMPSRNDGRMTLALSASGRYLAVGGNDHRCHIHDLDRDSPSVSFGVAKATSATAGWSALAIAGDQVFAASWADRSLHIHDIKTGGPIRPAAPTMDWIEALAFSSDGKRMAAAGQTGIIRLWDVDRGQESEPGPGHLGPIWRVQLTPDGRALTTSSDNVPRLWDLASGRELRRIDLPCEATSFTLSPDRSALLALCGFEIMAFDASNGARMAAPANIAASRETRFYSGDSRSLLIGEGKSIRVLAWPDGGIRRRFEFLSTVEGGDYAEVLQAGLTPDGKTLLVHTQNSGLEARYSVDLWDAGTGLFRARLLESHDESGRGIAFLDEGRHVVLPIKPVRAGGVAPIAGSRLGLWNLRSAKLVRAFEAPGSRMTRDLAADPGSYVLATAEEGENGFTLLYEIASGQIRRRIPGHLRANMSVAFTPDGNRLVTVGGDKTGLVWDISLAGAARRRKPASDDELELAWQALAKPNASDGYDALIVLATQPERAVEMARRRLKPATVDAAAIDRLIADLDSEKFVTREKATKELEKLSRAEIAALQFRAETGGSLELKRRLAVFLNRYDSGALSADELRSLRALEFLEQSGSPAARSAIAELTKGEPSADLTIRALAAKGRLDRRKN